MIASGGGESAREVIISLKAAVDRAATRNALNEFVAGVKSAQTTSTQVINEGAKEQARVFGDGEKKKRDEVSKTAKEVVKGAHDQNRAYQALIDQQKKAAAELQKHHAALESANDKMAEGFKQSLSGAMSLGRGVAMLGLVGERDTEKLLRALIKVQAAFDVMRGVIELVQGITRAWKAYTAAVQAAAAAHGVLTAAQAASIGAGGAKGAGAYGVGGAAAGGAAVGAGGMTAGLGVAAAGAATGGLLFGGSAVRAAWQHGIGGGAAPGTFADWMGTRQAEFGSWIYRKTGIGGGLLGRSQMSLASRQRFAATQIGQQQIAEQGISAAAAAAAQHRSRIQWNMGGAQAELELARGAQTEQNIFGGTSEASQAERDARHVEAIERVVKLRKEELQTQRQIAQEQIRGAREAIRGLEQQQKIHQQMAKQLREQGMTAMERFGALSAAEQQRLIATEKKYRTGGQLSREEEEALSAYGGADIQEDIARRRRERAKGLGWGAGGEYERRAREQERLAGDIEVRIKDQRELVVKIEREDQQLVDKVAKETKRLLDERDEIFARMFKAAMAENERRQAEAFTAIIQGNAAIGN